MTDHYEGLESLIAQDNEASQYYQSLPGYVREHIASRGQNVNSFASLRDYAENLLRGDI